MSEELHHQVCELAADGQMNDESMLRVFRRVADALVAEFGPTSLDTGMGGGWCDFWLREGDVEYKLVMKPHKSLAKPQ